MLKFLSIIFAVLIAGHAWSDTGVPILSSIEMEKELQTMPWKQFRSVISAIPKLKASIDVYGALGWQFVRSRYATHPWHKGIDKLDDAEKIKLTELIRQAKSGASSSPPRVNP